MGGAAAGLRGPANQQGDQSTPALVAHAPDQAAVPPTPHAPPAPAPPGQQQHEMGAQRSPEASEEVEIEDELAGADAAPEEEDDYNAAIVSW